LQEIDHLLGSRRDAKSIYPTDIYAESRADGKKTPIDR
jgi:hypothetical protein